MPGSEVTIPDRDAPEPILLSVLGHVRATRGGRELELGPPKHRAVLAALAMAEGEPLSAESIAGMIWPEDQVPANPTGGLHVVVSGLRRTLETARGPRARPEVLLTGGGGYRLDRDRVVVDAREVSAAARASRAVLADAHRQVVPRLDAAADVVARALADVERALAQWRGEPYADLLPTVPVLSARAGLEATMAALVDDRAVALILLGRHAEAAAMLSSTVVERPFDERLWSLHAIALAGAGRQADALEALRTLRATLADELGVDAGPSVRELESLVLRQDPSLLPGAALREVVAVGPSVEAATSTSAGAADDPAPEPSIVGRESERAYLMDRLTPSGPRAVQVVGEAGIGKSTLVQQLTAAARERGHLVAVARCPEDPGAPPFWPWVELLTDLASASEDEGVLREPLATLRDEAGTPLETLAGDQAETARFRLAESIAQAVGVVAARRPCLLVLEDLHWASASSSRVVAHLADSWAIRPDGPDLLLVVTRRPDDVDASPGLVAALESLARSDGARIDLEGLSPEEVGRLASQRSSLDLGASEVAALHARTHGNPFLLVELLRLGPDALTGAEVPAGVAEVVARRLARMPEQTRTALLTASVLGHRFDLGLLASVLRSGSGEATPEPAGRVGDELVDSVLDSLDPALAAGLLVDVGADEMAFAHALTRDAILLGVSPARRTRLHARAARAIEESGRAGSSEAARHWLSAGARYAARAWRAAAEAARSMAHGLALEEAADLLDEAVTIQARDADATVDDQLALTQEAARALMLAGRWDRFLHRVDEAAALAERNGRTEDAARLAIMPAEAGPWTPRAWNTTEPAAVRRLRRLLEDLPPHDHELRCRAMLALGSELYFSPGSAQERRALVDEGLAMARRLGDPALLGRISQRAALVIWRGGNADERLALATEAVDALSRTDDVDQLQTVLELRMSAALEAGDIGRMLADVERAEGLLDRRPTAYHAVVVACLLVPWLAAQGRDREAEERLGEAARLARGTQLPWAGVALGSAAVGLVVWRGPVDADPFADIAAEVQRSVPSARLLLALRSGDLESARDFLRTGKELLVSDDFASLFHRAVAAEAAYVLGDAALATEAYADLAGEAGHVASAGTGIPLGPVDAYLALAAAATGDLRLAARHGDEALRLIDAWQLSACGAWLREHRAAGGW